jgi:hypothetical protein
VSLLIRKEALAVFALLWSSGIHRADAAAKLPNPPCAGQPVPEYPQVGNDPNVRLWTASDLGTGWSAPDCTAWKSIAANVVVGLAGRFRYGGSIDSLLARFGAISSLVEVRYWSVTQKQWNNMFTHAVALSGPDPKKPRGDFSAAELRAGATMYFVAADNRSGKDSVSELRTVSADRTHFALETENVTPLRWTFLTYADPGSFQTWYFLDHDVGDSWRFYSLTRVVYASAFFDKVIPNDSYVNRAVAMYRHVLALPAGHSPIVAP